MEKKYSCIIQTVFSLHFLKCPQNLYWSKALCGLYNHTAVLVNSYFNLYEKRNYKYFLAPSNFHTDHENS